MHCEFDEDFLHANERHIERITTDKVSFSEPKNKRYKNVDRLLLASGQGYERTVHEVMLKILVELSRLLATVELGEGIGRIQQCVRA